MFSLCQDYNFTMILPEAHGPFFAVQLRMIKFSGYTKIKRQPPLFEGKWLDLSNNICDLYRCIVLAAMFY
jgi:hypothetical protein